LRNATATAANGWDNMQQMDEVQYGAGRSMQRPRRPTDEELVGQLAAGDAAAFNVIFDRYHKPIYNFIKKQVLERENVEDLAQEVFMRVFKSARNFDTTKKFSSWVYKIALNEVKRHWKRSGSRQTFSLNVPVGEEGGDSERGDFIEDQRVAPAAAAEQDLFSRDLKTLIDRLPEKQKTVVLLKVYNELTFEEIAEICECPLSTVLSRMRYAVSKLRRWLGLEEGDDSDGL
jgi:RNA polymerase sigma-70 factor, ECF subfamily